MATVDIRPFEDPDAATIARLSTTVQWPSLTNAEVVMQVCNAPGAVAYVALCPTIVSSAGPRRSETVSSSHT